MTFDKPIALCLVAVAVVCIAFAIIIGRIGDQQPSARTRVPNIPESTAAAVKAAQDAQAAAATATQAQHDIQAQLAQLADDAKKEKDAAAAAAKPPAGPVAPYGKEITSPGIVTDFGVYPLTSSTNADDMYLGFTFTDRTGFTKKFFPVCTGQTLKTGTPITLIYHWRDWTREAEGMRGCFEIDGFQQ